MRNPPLSSSLANLPHTACPGAAIPGYSIQATRVAAAPISPGANSAQLTASSKQSPWQQDLAGSAGKYAGLTPGGDHIAGG